MASPLRPVAVVDDRTYRIACRRIGDLLDRGEIAWAAAAAAAVREWLRGEIHTGPKSKRAKRAMQLEQFELRMAQAWKEVDW